MLIKLKNYFGNNIFLPIFLVISIFAVGLFHNPVAFAASVVLCVFLAVCAVKRNELGFNVNISSVSVVILVTAYLVTAVWAVDSGLALFGFFRYLAVGLFMIAMMQKNAPSKDSMLLVVAYAGAVMSVVSAVFMQIKPLSEHFSVAGRLAGFWQYPNSFAMLLLCGVVVLLTKEKLTVYDFVSLAVLAFGIIYSGSRIALAVAVVSVLAVLIFRRGKKLKLIVAAVIAVGVIGAVVYGLVSGNISFFARYIGASLTESTFIGRILYLVDSIPLVLKHPFGMGYFGYYFTHTNVQTGVYELSFVHNDFVQLMLDIGWIPTGVFIAAIFKSFFKKGTSLRIRVLLFAICAHAFFDFDLQFIAMVMILVLCLDFESGKQLVAKKCKGTVCALAGALCALVMYFGIEQSAYLFGNINLAYSMYKGDTLAAIHLLINESDVSKSLELADDILEKNEHCTIAASAKARCSFSKGDLVTAMEYKNKVLEMAPFEYEEYKEYCQMLVYSIQVYTKAGDSYSADICKQELRAVVSKLEGLESRVSKLGSMIKDQPKTKLTGEISVLVEEYLGK